MTYYVTIINLMDVNFQLCSHSQFYQKEKKKKKEQIIRSKAIIQYEIIHN